MWEGDDGDYWDRDGHYKALTLGTIESKRGEREISDRYFKLVPQAVKKDVSRDTKEKEQKKHNEEYEFRTGSPDIIDLDEIPLTRENPVAIVKRSDGVHTLLCIQAYGIRRMHLECSMNYRGL
jgi:hypothetical protein